MPSHLSVGFTTLMLWSWLYYQHDNLVYIVYVWLLQTKLEVPISSTTLFLQYY
jgi:hypothetical protein